MFIIVTAENFATPVYLNPQFLAGFRRITGKAFGEVPYTWIWDQAGNGWHVSETPEEIIAQIMERGK